ncbi:MAG: hypothetical protein CMD02_03410 [Flavobacteriales bacterium]|nr:hypothetical protein [Flavobacteriales bacterium]|tara:strand:+ start:10597 stop:10962 length:366 start_codon:yes stop_codon:yes gene_type:complete
MKNNVLNFHGWLVFTLTLSFVIHNFIVDPSHLLFLYSLNFSIAIFVYWLVFILRNKQKESLGYYFLAGTLIKFLVFFFIILPVFKEDEVVTKTEFFSFFTPYVISLFVETKCLISLLNSDD